MLRPARLRERSRLQRLRNLVWRVRRTRVEGRLERSLPTEKSMPKFGAECVAEPA